MNSTLKLRFGFGWQEGEMTTEDQQIAASIESGNYNQVQVDRGLFTKLVLFLRPSFVVETIDQQFVLSHVSCTKTASTYFSRCQSATNYSAFSVQESV